MSGPIAAAAAAAAADISTVVKRSWRMRTHPLQRSAVIHRPPLDAVTRAKSLAPVFLLIFAAMATVEIQQAVIVHAALSLLVLRAEGKR